MSYRLMSLALLLVSAGPSVADNMKMPMNANDLKWGPAPAVLPRGAEATIISGDPSKNEPYVLRVRMPAGYKVPAHHHPTTESVTVLSGNFHLGMGDKLDEKNGMELTAGGYAEAPANMNHSAFASSPVVIQIHGQGPFATTYVNPADDPSKR